MAVEIELGEGELLDLTDCGLDAVALAAALRADAGIGARGGADEDPHCVVRRYWSELAKVFKAVRICEMTDGVGETVSVAVLDQSVVTWVGVAE